MSNTSPSIRSAFLETFESSGFRTNIIEYGKMLTALSREVDVLMFMARKAVCLAECLEATRLTTFYGPVVSDRVLDTDVGWMRGKTIGICDDALISGTTLFRTLERLQHAGVRRRDLTTRVLCVNTKWQSDNLVAPAKPYLELSDIETASLCARIVDGISIIPRPYAVDYPLYRGIRLAVRDLDCLAAMFDWTVDDVSSPLQVVNGVFSLTLTPTESLQCSLDASLGWRFSDSGLHKLRLYGRLHGTERRSCWCSMFPIVALDPLPAGTVHQLFESLAGHTGNKRAFTALFSPRGVSPEVRADCELTAKARAIAYVAASRLAGLWHQVLQSILSTTVNLKQDSRTLSYLFPPDTTEIIRDMAAGNAPLFRHANFARRRTPSIHPPTNPASPQLASPRVIDGLLTEPFLDLYRTKELRTRELVLKHGRQVFEMPEYRDLLNRLNTGFTLPELRSLLSGFRDIIRVDKVISLFLDRSIDRGIVVPITATRNGFVQRAYRHGEDVEFGEAEEHLCVHALHMLSQASGRQELPKTWVEKVLVLLIRIGLEQQFFNAWDQTLGDHETVGIRYTLHGAVTAIGAPKMYLPQEYFGPPEMMREHGYIAPVEGSGYWRVVNVPNGGVHAERAEKARLVGSVMGRVLADKNPKIQVKDDELVLLATCLYPRDIAGALAAEIAIIARLWSYLKEEFKPRSIVAMDASDALLMSNKLRGSAAFTAANSGTWKAANYASSAEFVGEFARIQQDD